MHPFLKEVREDLVEIVNKYKYPSRQNYSLVDVYRKKYKHFTGRICVSEMRWPKIDFDISHVINYSPPPVSKPVCTIAKEFLKFLVSTNLYEYVLPRDLDDIIEKGIVYPISKNDNKTAAVAILHRYPVESFRFLRSFNYLSEMMPNYLAFYAAHKMSLDALTNSLRKEDTISYGHSLISPNTDTRKLDAFFFSEYNVATPGPKRAIIYKTPILENSIG